MPKERSLNPAHYQSPFSVDDLYDKADADERKYRAEVQRKLDAEELAQYGIGSTIGGKS